MINPRKSMQICSEFPRKAHSLITRYEKSRSYHLQQQQNERIAKILGKIKNSNGILGRMEEAATLTQKKKLSLVSDFSISQKKREIQKGNKRMIQKIDQIKPFIGTSELWDSRIQNLSEQKRRLSKGNFNEIFHAEILLNEKNPNLKHNLEKTLDLIFCKTAKSSSHNRKGTKLQQVNKNKSNHKTSHTYKPILGNHKNNKKINLLNEEELVNNFLQKTEIKAGQINI